jgi:hypothetical protein
MSDTISSGVGTVTGGVGAAVPVNDLLRPGGELLPELLVVSKLILPLMDLLVDGDVSRPDLTDTFSWAFLSRIRLRIHGYVSMSNLFEIRTNARQVWE